MGVGGVTAGWSILHSLGVLVCGGSCGSMNGCGGAGTSLFDSPLTGLDYFKKTKSQDYQRTRTGM